jgi:fimbrial chaperone protein
MRSIFLRAARSLRCISPLMATLAMLVLQVSHAFEVFPVRLYFDEFRTTATVTYTNTNSHDIAVQPRLMLWTQTSGVDGGAPVDALVETKDFLVFPPLVQLKPRQKQTVRLRYTGKTSPDKQLTYRVLSQEIPMNVQEGTINFTRTMSVPLFGRSKKDLPPELEWTLRKRGVQYALDVNNVGQNHIQITGVILQRDGAEADAKDNPRASLSSYFLSGVSGAATLEFTPTPVVGERYKALLETDYKRLEKTITLQ